LDGAHGHALQRSREARPVILDGVMTAILALILMATPPSTDHVVQVVEHYGIEVPAGYILKDVSPKQMDFDLYALADTRTGSVKCTLYFGNAPAFPKLRWSGKPTESRQHGASRKEFRSSDRIEGLMNFDGLSYKGVPASPFESVHYFADHLSTADVKLVATMVDSITIAKKDLK
jgi:hypothetical protein